MNARVKVGPYTLLRVTRGGLDPGTPGQFFMLEAPGRLLPRPMSLYSAPAGELWFLIDEIVSGTRAICASDELHVFGPLGRGFDQSRDPGTDHYGLIGMRERADALGAHLVVESKPGEGTRVSVSLEVPK